MIMKLLAGIGILVIFFWMMQFVAVWMTVKSLVENA